MNESNIIVEITLLSRLASLTEKTALNYSFNKSFAVIGTLSLLINGL